MTQNKLYSIKEMAEQLEMDWETLLNWKYQYLFHLPAHHQEKQLKYPAETTALFQFIKEAKASGLHDDVIQLWVDKQVETFHSDRLELSSALYGLITDLQTELTMLHSQWEQKCRQQQRQFLTLMENITWEELKLLQEKCPDLFTLEEDEPVKQVRKGRFGNFFERVSYN
jgi:DNA-binding transcriptional MerR regulator